MKKMKLSFGQDEVKRFLLQHVEKVVFGITVLLVVLFVYFGYRLPGFDKNHTPDDLKRVAETAEQHIVTPTWNKIREEREPRGDYENRVNDALAVTDADPYALRMPWDPPGGKPGEKRKDPQLFAVTNLEVVGVTGPLALQYDPNKENAVEKLDNAPVRDDKRIAREKKAEREKRAKERQKKKSGKRGGGGGARGGSPYGSGYYNHGESDDSGTKGSGDENKKKSGKGSGSQVVRVMPEESVPGYHPHGEGVNIAASERARQTGDSGGKPGIKRGLHAGGAGQMMGAAPGDPSGSGDNGAASSGRSDLSRMNTTGIGKALTVTEHLVIVKGLFPYRKEYEEYQNVLGNAVGYLPSRDVPQPIFFAAQRADVTDDPNREIKEEEWKNVMNTNIDQWTLRKQWHGVPAEPAEFAYVDPFITMPGPPLMMRSLDQLLLHSMIPKRQVNADAVATATTDQNEPREDADQSKPDLSGADLPGAAPPPGVGQAGPGQPPRQGGPPPGYPGPGVSGGSNYPGAGYPGQGYRGGYPGQGYRGGYPGQGYRGGGYPGQGYPGSGYPGQGYPGSGRNMPGAGYPGIAAGGTSGSRTLPVQYKLVRFIDANVEPGKVYRYRVRLYLEDPNNPNTIPGRGLTEVPPKPRTLDESVHARLAKEKSQNSDPKNPPYWVITPWSEASPPVSIPDPDAVFAGPVTPARYSTSGGLLIRQTEDSCVVAPVAFDPKLSTDISKEERAFRGSVLNVSGDFDVLDPVGLQIKLLKDAELKTDTLVVDMRGGEDLPGKGKDKLASPGEIALLTPEGQLVVHNELDDFNAFAQYTFADEVETTSFVGGGMPGIPGAGGVPGRGGGPHMPSAGPGTAPGAPAPPGGPGGDSGSKRGGSGRRGRR